VLYALSDGREGLSGWVVGLVFIGGLCGAFVWVEMLAGSSRWHRQGCLWAWNTVGTKCWDQIAEGYSILNTGKCEGELAKDGERR
jgi:hypothetical protein